jgi:hypothetical protein
MLSYGGVCFYSVGAGEHEAAGSKGRLSLEQFPTVRSIVDRICSKHSINQQKYLITVKDSKTEKALTFDSVVTNYQTLDLTLRTIPQQAQDSVADAQPDFAEMSVFDALLHEAEEGPGRIANPANPVLTPSTGPPSSHRVLPKLEVKAPALTVRVKPDARLDPPPPQGRQAKRGRASSSSSDSSGSSSVEIKSSPQRTNRLL